MSLQYFLEVSGLSGPSVFEDFAGAFKVRDFDFEAEHPRPTGGAANGPSDFMALRITLDDETGLTAFLSLIANQTRVAASLIGAKSGGDAGLAEVQRFNLAGAVVSNVQEQADGGYTVFLNYSSIGVVDQTQKPDGSAGTPETFGYDADQDAPTAVPPDAVPGAPIAAAGGADHYFLLIDGVDGGSIDEHHAGWFDLRNFVLDADSLFTRVRSGSTTDRVDFDSLRVAIDDQSGLTQLLAKVATGTSLAGARIEGVNHDGAVVYKLDIADVHVTQVVENNGEGYSAGLDFRRIQLTTRGQDDTGVLGPPQVFSYNIGTSTTNVGILPTLTPGATDSPRASTDYYLQVQGLGGPSTLEVAPGGFHVLAFTFRGDQEIAGGGGGATVGVTRFSHLELILGGDAGEAAFLKLLSTGVHTSAVSLLGLGNSGAGLSEAYRVNLGDVVVTRVSQAGAGTVAVSLDFKQIGVIEQTQKDNGSAGTPLVFGYDISAAHEIPPPPAAVPAASIADATPAKFFLLINGVDGGSTDARHAGWFELPSSGFNFNIASAGANGIGKVVYNPLNVEIGDSSGLTTLLQKLSTGGQISGVRLEGVTNDNHVVYKLDLADVRVTDVSEGDGKGYRASLDYNRVQLVTSGQKPDGSYGLEQTFSWDVAGGKADVGVLPTIAPVDTDGPRGASTYFLEVDGLTGPAHQVHFEGAFGIHFFNFGADLSVGSGGGGAGGVGKAVFTPLTFSVDDQSGLTDFLQMAATGQHLNAVSLIGAGNPGGGALTETYRVNLGDVIVTHVADNTGLGYTVSLEYGEIGVVLQTEKPTGQTGTPQTFGFDITEVHTEPPPPNAVPGPASSAGATSADHYFLLIDGIDGGSTDARHAGWFELPAFAFDVEAMFNGSAGAGVGKADLGPLSVQLLNMGGFTDALDSLAVQRQIAGARIEGVGTDGRVVYRLDIAEVRVTDVTDSPFDGYTASLDFDRVRLSTRAQNDDGSLGPEHVFTFDIPNNSTGIGTLPDISPGGTPVNHAPVAVADGPVAVNEDASVTLNVLGNDTDPDAGDGKFLVSVSATDRGSSVSIVNNQVVYSADADVLDLLKTGQTATDSFSYTMRDAGGLTSTATVSVTINGVADAPTQTGGAGADTQVGTAGDEKLDGGAGNDLMMGGGGADTLLGGLGNDSMEGGAGIDSLSGSDGNDTMDGGAGDDVLVGARGSDVFVVTGHFGHDTVLDFKPEDDVRFVGAGFANFADMLSHSAQAGAHVVITNALGDTLTLNNVQLGTLQSADFLFV